MKGQVLVKASVSTKHLFKIADVAVRVHRWCLKNQKHYKVGSNLVGMCGVASARLHSELKKAGIPKVKIAASRGHAYVLVGDSLIVDATYGQFDPSVAVFIGTADFFPIGTKTHVIETVLPNSKALIDWMVGVGWDSLQVPKM